jgi:hypothetical protein
MVKYLSNIPNVHGFLLDEGQGFLFSMIQRSGSYHLECREILAPERVRWEIDLTGKEQLLGWTISKGYVLVNLGGVTHVYYSKDGTVNGVLPFAFHCIYDSFLIGEVQRGGVYSLVKVGFANNTYWEIEDTPNVLLQCNTDYVIAVLIDTRVDTIRGYSCKTGEFYWEVNVSGYGKSRPNPLLPEQPCSIAGDVRIFGERVLVSLSVDKLLVLDAKTGKEVALYSDVSDRLFVSNEGLVYELLPDRYAILNLNTADRAVIKSPWQGKDLSVTSGGGLTKFTVHGRYLFGCGISSSRVFVMDAITGVILWSENLPSGEFIPFDYRPQFASGRLFIRDSKYTVYVYSVD